MSHYNHPFPPITLCLIYNLCYLPAAPVLVKLHTAEHKTVEVEIWIGFQLERNWKPKQMYTFSNLIIFFSCKLLKKGSLNYIT